MSLDVRGRRPSDPDDEDWKNSRALMCDSGSGMKIVAPRVVYRSIVDRVQQQFVMAQKDACAGDNVLSN